jgi:hypothetical protein
LRYLAVNAAAAVFIIHAPKWSAIGRRYAPKQRLFYLPRRADSPQTPEILGKCRNGPAAEMKKRAAI